MPSPEVTITDLKRILRSAAGADENVDLDGDILDVEFRTLGYDSLALLETTARITQEFGIKLGDDVAATATTPRAMLAVVNGS